MDGGTLIGLLTSGILYALIALLCIGGVLLSFFSVSGTWLVLAATVLAGIARQAWSPWGWLAGGYLVLCVAIEAVENLAGIWGVKRRGGTFLAGVAAMGGGLAGMLLGAWIPIPVLGPLIGMLAGTFAAVYAVEARRDGGTARAAHVARGALWSRAAMILVKTGATVLMAGGLFAALLATRSGA